MEVTVESLLKRGNLFLDDEDWKNADEYFDRALDIDPERAEGYIGKLMAELKVKQEAELAQSEQSLADNGNYKKALRFADAAQRAVYENYEAAIQERFALKYQQWQSERSANRQANMGSNTMGIIEPEKPTASTTVNKKPAKRRRGLIRGIILIIVVIFIPNLIKNSVDEWNASKVQFLPVEEIYKIYKKDGEDHQINTRKGEEAERQLFRISRSGTLEEMVYLRDNEDDWFFSDLARGGIADRIAGMSIKELKRVSIDDREINQLINARLSNMESQSEDNNTEEGDANVTTAPTTAPEAEPSIDPQLIEEAQEKFEKYAEYDIVPENTVMPTNPSELLELVNSLEKIETDYIESVMQKLRNEFGELPIGYSIADYGEARNINGEYPGSDYGLFEYFMYLKNVYLIERNISLSDYNYDQISAIVADGKATEQANIEVFLDIFHEIDWISYDIRYENLPWDFRTLDLCWYMSSEHAGEFLELFNVPLSSNDEFWSHANWWLDAKTGNTNPDEASW